ncbi:two-component sensor histidine kinase [Actinoplanes sp. OR16]|uniref:sensor histidine kinase n=1 Tax=Actinoplanes sp. OR16 TaxID=946334 RepID=UPI000F72076F|nr:sensor histidine kinase [Actinoplanes sp. OR16]BBH64318.1 two-component sensor histidine kinase [Actinoplanes sp. OR16]
MFSSHVFAPHVEEWRRPGPTARQRRADLWIGFGVAGVAVLNLYTARSFGMLHTEDAPGVAEQIAWSVCTTLPLAWRRRWPEAVAVIMSLVYIGGQVRGVQEQQVASYALYAAIYTLGAWGPVRHRARTLRLVIIAAMFTWLTVALATSWDEIVGESFDGASGELPVLWSLVFNQYFVNAIFFGSVYLVGDYAWQAARRLDTVQSQAAELRAAQAASAERAVVDERVRIARELHDVVAHHVSVMGIQASACRRALDKDPARARTALTAIEQGARTAVDELRRMLGALRSTGSDFAPDAAAAGIDRIPQIAENAREAGLTVHFAVFGDEVPLPDSVSQTAYRIAQEAVTNTLKHARATTLDIRIRYLNDSLEVDVSDDGHGQVFGNSGGMGVIGMRERVAVHDGALEVGPRSGGGYRVRARLPHHLVMAGESK